MKKKLLLFMALLCTCVSGAWAEVRTANVLPSTDVANPENVYYILSRGSSNRWSKETYPTTTEGEFGHFAFFAVEGKANTYRIYSIDAQKWVSYSRAGSYSDCQDFLTVGTDNEEDAEYFYFTKGISTSTDASADKSGFLIAPYRTNDPAGRYLNWYRGAGQNSGHSVGLYNNSWDDAGSVWALIPANDDTKQNLAANWRSTLPSTPGLVGSYTAEQIESATEVTYDGIPTWEANNSPLAFDVNKYYRVYNYTRNSANYAWTVTDTQGKIYPNNDKDLNQVVKFEASDEDGKYYIKSYSNGKYFPSVWGNGDFNLVAIDAENVGKYQINTKTNNGLLFSFNCGTNQRQFLFADGNNKLDGWTGDDCEFFYMQEVDINDFPVKNSDITANYYQIKCNGNEYYMNPYTFPTNVEAERGVFQFFVNTDGANGGKYYIYEAGSKKWLKYTSANDGAKKVTLADNKAEASLFVADFVSGQTDQFNIGPNTSLSFNWHGGVNTAGKDYIIETSSHMNGVGFHQINDGNSKWNLFAVTENIDDAISNSATTYVKIPAAEILAEAKKYSSSIGNDLNKYSTTVDQTTFNNAVNALENATGDDIATTAATVKGYLDNLHINLPTVGYYYVRSANNKKYLSSVNNGGHVDYTKDYDSKDHSNIFYFDGTHLLGYKSGTYIVANNSNFPANAAEYNESNAAPIAFSGSPVYLGTYNITFNDAKNRYMHESGTAGNNAANSDDKGYTFWLEAVPNMYAVTINDADAYVQTADEVQVKNGGYLYVANGTAEVTASEKAGYTVDVVKNDNPNTISVTYTKIIELADGYFYIKNAATDKYLVNTFDTGSATTTTTLANKETRNNGVWKVTCNEDKDGNVTSINLVNGIGTSPNVGATSYNTLTIGSTGSSIYFTQGLDGTDDNLTAGAADAASSRWILEPIANSMIVANLNIYGGEENTYITFKKSTPYQYALDGGFFTTTRSGDLNTGDEGNFEFPDLGKESSKDYSAVRGELNVVYCTSEDIAKLKTAVKDAHDKIMADEIGYPKSSLIDWYNDEDPMAIICQYYGSSDFGLGGIDSQTYPTVLLALRDVTQIPDINLPTPGNFYTFEDNAKVKKTYYLTENNELLSYENGLFAKPEYSEEKGTQIVDYSKAGTVLGEGDKYGFQAARTNEMGKPINFGKVCAWGGNGPLPSGDLNFYSGWTITKNDKLALTVKSSGYSTFYCPVDVQFTEANAYTAKIDEEKCIITFNELTDGKVPAGTAVLVEKIGGGKADPKIWTGDALAPVDNKGDLLGSYVSLPCKQAEVTDKETYTTINEETVYFHIYTMQSGKWKYYTGEKLSGFKAYFGLHDITPEGTVKAYTFRFADGSDATSVAEALGLTNTKKEVYDLSGRRVQNAKKGLYIVNGKKVIKN